MRRIILLITCMIGVAVLASAQDQNIDQLQEKLKGTYQIQILKHSRAPMELDESIFTTIDEKRKQDQVVYHYINPKLRIMILPEKQIAAENFKPIEVQKIIHNFEE